MNDSFIWLVTGVYIIVALIAISYFPLWLAPNRKALQTETIREILDLQNKIRQTVIQVVGGLGILFTIYMAIQAQKNANFDLSQRYDRETAELFVKAVESKSPEALYVLSYIARRDQEHYRDTTIQLLISSIQTASRASCQDNKYMGADFVPDSKIQVALRILAERGDRASLEKLNL